MNNQEAAAALRKVSEAIWDLAAAIDTAVVGTPAVSGRESATASPSGSPAPSYSEPPQTFDDWPQPSLADESVAFAPQGSLAVCPKHHQPYADGRYGPFCKSLTDDEAWGKKKPDGKVFCSITPKNAAEWLRQQAAVVVP